MIKLINGRGQVGEELSKNLPNCQEDIFIYHTWNVWDKTQKPQQCEYFKFKEFVNEHGDDKIIFISTYSEQENWYNHYKQLSEAYLINNCSKGLILRVPVIIGKGVCQKMKDGEVEPYGVMELVTVQDVSKRIIELCSYDGNIKSFRMEGNLVPAKIAYSLITL
tara:strand:- start:1202 stop:1693 length:492 start_codon:yes stop_codon:yes gene_type:complete